MIWISGQQLQGGKYVIEQVLGQGGFGITYKARHALLNNLVVIKTPNENLQHDPEYPKYVKRFIDEGQRLEKLSQTQHPNIVRIRDLFHESGTYCLVMDFVQGQSLFELVQQQGKLPPDVAVQYVQQIAQALIVVHAFGLVHRDAHPGNINDNQDRSRRGGSWLLYPSYCRSASRYNIEKALGEHFNSYIGFRVVCAAGRILQ